MILKLRNLRHNLIAHPVAGIFWFFGLEKVGNWVHDNW
jgi:hypothetical protein